MATVTPYRVYSQSRLIELSCSNIEKGCEWTGTEDSALQYHLNSDDLTTDNWLEGCDYASVGCVFCKDEEIERHQYKKKLSDTVLVDEDLADVLETVWLAKDKWYHLGLQLKVDSGTLDAIEKEERRNEDRLRRMLITWLRANGKKSWQMLQDALRAKSVDHADVAEDVLICK